MLYKNILITLNHIEKRNNITRQNVLEKIKKFFNKESVEIIFVIISKENHEKEGYHYHVFIQNKGFLKKYKNFIKKIRELFPEFDGRSIDVAIIRGINNTIEYVTKEDTSPLLYKITKEQIILFKKAIKTKQNTKIYTTLYKDLIKKETWNDVLADKNFGPYLLKGFNSIKTFYFEYKKMENEKNAIEKENKIELYKTNKLKIDEFDVEKAINISKKHHLLIFRWLWNNSFHTRKIRDSQLLIVGESSIGKTKFIRNLLKSLDLKVYNLNSQDFTGYKDDLYDIILIDEFEYSDFDRSFLLKLLEGSSLQITGKYQETTRKNRNLPIILILNPSRLIKQNKHTEAFYKRVQIVNFIEAKEQKMLYDKEFLSNFFFKYNINEDLKDKNLNIQINNIQINNIFKNNKNNE